MLGNILAEMRFDMAKNVPHVAGDRVYGPNLPTGGIALDSPAWFEWLESPEASSFAYPVFVPKRGYIVGVVTVRKERRQRGSLYWVAYRRDGQRLRKVYIGPAAQVTTQRLEGIVAQWQSEASDTDEEPAEDAVEPARSDMQTQEGDAESSDADVQENLLPHGGISMDGVSRTWRRRLPISWQ
jgi:hypothetical protein